MVKVQKLNELLKIYEDGVKTAFEDVAGDIFTLLVVVLKDLIKHRKNEKVDWAKYDVRAVEFVYSAKDKNDLQYALKEIISLINKSKKEKTNG